MHAFSFLFFLSLLISLLSVAGPVPATLYQGDGRSPKTIKDRGGFKSRGVENKKGLEGTVIQHMKGKLPDPNRDPFISTMKSLNFIKEYTGNGYLYTINRSKVADEILDVTEEFQKAGEEYKHSREQEFSVKGTIPWAAIETIQKQERGRGWVTLNKEEMSKRAAEFPDEDIFMDSPVRGRERV